MLGRTIIGQRPLDDYDSMIEVSTFKSSTILEFKNGKGTITTKSEETER